MIKSWLAWVVLHKIWVTIGAVLIVAGSSTAAIVGSQRRATALEEERQRIETAARQDQQRRLAALASPSPSPTATTASPSPSSSPTPKTSPSPTAKASPSPSPSPTPATSPSPSPSPSSVATSCTTPLSLRVPVDLAGVTSILYPGQVRGGDFKPHGGFRFDNSADGAVTVVAPYAATIVSGSRYIESGTIQYLFDFQVSGCSTIRYRFDHLQELSSKLQAIANTLPEPQADDTRTTSVSGSVSAGETLATKIGVPGNSFVDWGVYNMGQNNGFAGDPNDSLAAYGVCWFDWIGGDGATVRSLSATGGNSSSEYCR